ncbi:3-deoxy-manno-octulosonate cytidylyltransferase [Thiohalobacter sp. IOR34]|uniref:3-deoxy-manno-octulosonate cytidylyltransferase n=1 Tax=Thiohalobacter sp. IOR34 TaxID=3057176 RepID=UPI0025AFE459|nr:3-deoxy-manno-octulosonate cytidylyltransferase [Thiohalobacter sp. IOR34]WJW76783.1 3-deoxy-manno-octulosonate cytidylyltransferase [Thiohalobacter sp. IOR34]
MSEAFRIVIPARHASSRLPGKPLLPLAGRPMLEHVHRLAQRAGAEAVVIATDDARIEAAARAFGAEVLMTRDDHPSGTDRLAEVVERLDWPEDAIVVNLQGDEPLMPPSLVRTVAADLARHPAAEIATLCTPIGRAEDFFDPHIVKVVRDQAGYALYFSRAPIPWDRDEFATGSRLLPAGVPHLRHIGLYAYRVGYLRRYRNLPAAPIERSEMLEQLRALWHGTRIHVAEAPEEPGPGVDTRADLERVAALLGE